MIRIVFILCLYPIFIFSQVPEDRRTNWSEAGLKPSIRLHKTVGFKGGSGMSAADNSRILSEQITAAKEGTIITFEAGVYRFNQSISMKSGVVLKGEGSKATFFEFNLGGKGDCIQMFGSRNNTNYTFESSEVNTQTVPSQKEIAKGDLLFFYNNNRSLLNDDWAKNHFGQLSVVEAHEKEIELSDPLRLTYPSGSYYKKVNPIVEAGVMGIFIKRKDKSSSKVNNIHMKYALHCFVDGIESEKTNYAHVAISHSYGCEVYGSYFHESFSYGSGGKGYGVVLHFSSSNNLVHHNIFKKLRHAMLLQAGANGNVVAYNYSIDPYWNQGFFPSNTAGDMVLHGNYPYLNLFESNVAQNLIIDGSHGINGPYNTFLRNRLEFLGITSISFPATNGLQFLANEITDEGLLAGLFTVMGSNHIYAKNIAQGNVRDPWSGEIPSSMYLNTKDRSMTDFGETFPVIGESVNYNKLKIPAQLRYENGNTTKLFANRIANKKKDKPKRKAPFWKRWRK